MSDFIRAFHEAKSGNVEVARGLLLASPDAALREWFDVHGQNVGTWRYKAFNLPAPEKDLPLDPVKSFAKFEVPLFSRDNYRCRYCQSQVLPAKVFRSLQGLVGEEYIPLKGTNSGRSGFYLMYCATLDHVLPHSLGGRTDENNLVTCCWSCNYGKTNYSLEQLGLGDPFSREPSSDSTWRGLTDFIEGNS